MKFGFFYDGPVTQNSKEQYFGTSINDEMFQKYFHVAENLHVCIRVKESDETQGLKKIENEKITFTKCINLSSISGMIKYKQAKNIIMKVLEDCDGAFIRLPSRIGLVAIECCRKLNKPYMVEVVACAWDVMWFHSIKGKIMALPTFLQTKFAIQHAPAVLYVTQKSLQNKYPTNGISIGCSDVNISEIEEKVIKKRINKINEKKWNADTIVIGTTGAVHVKFKGQERVIYALGELKKKGYTNYEYQLVGGGNQEYLRKIAKENNVEDQVKFIGSLPQESVVKWLDEIDLYIQPSETEGLPRSLVEAMSRGVPSFGTNIGGIPELLADEYLFSNSKRSIEEIQNILLDINPKKLVRTVESYFDIVKEYEYTKLESCRQAFYDKVFNIN